MRLLRKQARLLLLAYRNSFRGLLYALRSERAARQEGAAIALLTPVAFAVAEDFAGWVGLIGVLLFVLTVELVNTAVEKLCDRVEPNWDADIGIVKDVMSSAVLCALILAGLVWLTAIGRLIWRNLPFAS